MYKYVLIFFLFTQFIFGKCELLQKASNDILSVDCSQNFIAYNDGKTLYIKEANSAKNLFDLKAGSDEISVVKIYDQNVIVGFDSGFAIQTNIKGFQETLLDPLKTGVFERVTSINLIKDKLIFTLGNSHIIIYDTINKIYKKADISLNSKIIATKFINGSLFIACYDRNLYKFDLATLKQSHILKASNLITSIEELHQKPLIGLINGKLIYEQKIYDVTQNQISALKVKDKNIYVGDSRSNLYIYDSDLNLKNKTKIGNDTIFGIFIENSGIVVLWNVTIFACDFNGIK
ncbi:hypothetical protein FFA43_02430 [Campylobacter hyointestinalis subsp. hyointestinalis]|uniref:Uncharacterized protein n=1 Tax=Campylobacter hyointestinalis subsp. hyointestinalis TaxID=91352 RepID=A0A9W5EUZ3_CAMHY|nr:hypothetical protein [Campylobacter hyointestinalis]QCT99557.1 hypothetical protein FFA43_02430 [Campylobacter hyointestinalis subsp. hyointestinalis]TWO22729.1 hypothetical protein YZ80_00325 [Campylobacter hyointestinalis]CUU74954.1 Uncharacterised protein [Campylobacter hyointestinalis subsp. hyointestinalis]CUU83017.1 Uncharacterised protein [Campylobacter hyointestinalis subsp. hyointestinalis]